MYHSNKYKFLTAILILVLSLFVASSAQAQTLGRDGLPILNQPNATTPGSDCYFAHEGVGCDDQQCEASICAVDSYCCETDWDNICAGEAVQLCDIPEEDAGPRATFRAQKYHTDDNPADVTVTLSCYTGLPLIQSQKISNSQDVTMIVQSFNDGELDCVLSEDEATVGYTPTYFVGVPGTAKSDGCYFDDVVFGSSLNCIIYNDPTPVEVSVNKDWVIDGKGGDLLDPAYKLVLRCDNEITNGTTMNNGNWKKTLYKGVGNGFADKTYTASVVPYWDGGTSCWVNETVYDSAVEVDSDCGNNKNPGMNVKLDDGDSCTITNTVFFEGIPTLSQYGLIIAALGMLGLGLVGFRRFV